MPRPSRGSPLMISTPHPTAEALGRGTLRDYQVPDTPAEPEFDDIVELAAQICATPMAALGLVDSDRLWFMAHHGFPSAEPPRDGTFCAHAICSSDPVFVVPDARIDERFRDHPHVTGALGVRFYAAAPLVTPSGRVIGALCVIDRTPREITGAQRQALKILGRQAIGQLEMRRSVAAQQEELKARRMAEENLRRREAILEVISSAAETVLNAGDRESTVLSILERFGRATRADRVSVWQRRPDPGDVDVLSLRHGWSHPAVASWESLGVDTIPWDPDSMLPAQKLLMEDQPIQGRLANADPMERKMLERLGEQAFICMPIGAARGQVWGTLTLGYTRPDVQWSPAEIDALRSATRVLWTLFRNWATEEALRKSRERFRALSASAPIGIFETDASALHNLYSNERMQVIFGLTAREIIDGHWRRMIHPEDRPKVMAAWKAAHRRRAAIFVESRIVRERGSIRWIKLLASPMMDAHGRIAGFVGTLDDVTESHLMVEALRESETRYRSVVINLKEIVFQTDAGGRWTFLNPAWTEITGFNVGESLGQHFLDYVHPDDRERNRQLFAPLIQGEMSYCRHEVRCLTQDGGFRWIEVFARPSLDEHNRIVGITGTLNDITARREADELIASSLHEKELLLKEVNHRVKNNMQVISSLLNLQASQVEDAAVREMFAEAQNRIASMALVHEKFYQSSDLGQIDFADYLRELTDHLQGLEVSRAHHIRLELATPPLLLGIDTAIPCGLIINELVTNAYKHAFPNRGAGRVAIALERVAGGRLRLEVSDDGCGLPAGFDLRQSGSLGLKLVNTLVCQLRGTMTVRSAGGTGFILHLQEARRKGSKIT